MHATWAHPIALTALVAWAAASPWLLRGSRGPAVEIPFLSLWKSGPTDAVLRRRRVPPWPVLVVWLAAGVAIVAAAGPRIVPAAARAIVGAEPVKILDLSARSGVVPEVMIRCSNPAGVGSAPLRIETAGHTIEQTLPTDAAPHFVAVPSLGPVVRATVGEESAEAVRPAGWPAVAVEGDLPPTVTRFAAVYTAQRPRSGASVVLAPAGGDVFGPAVEVVKGPGGQRGVSSVDISASAVAADVRTWPAPADSLARQPTGFVPQVRRGGVVLMATREQPARQVWVNLDWAGWGDSDDAVVLLANAVEWAGGGGDPIYRLQRAPGAVADRPGITKANATAWAGTLCVGGVLLCTAAVLSTPRKSAT